MITPIAARDPVVAGFRHANWRETRSVVMLQSLEATPHSKLADRRQSLRRDLPHQAESAVSGPWRLRLPPDLSHLLGPVDGSATRALWIGSGEGYPPLPAPRSNTPT
jgi:hypothetical protein